MRRPSFRVASPRPPQRRVRRAQERAAAAAAVAGEEILRVKTEGAVGVVGEADAADVVEAAVGRVVVHAMGPMASQLPRPT